MKAVWNGIVLAESDDTVVVEGNHYFPEESINREYFRDSSHQSLCPWKGIAAYYTVRAGGASSRDAAWTYHHPLPWIRKIRDHVAFWGGVEVKE